MVLLSVVLGVSVAAGWAWMASVGGAPAADGGGGHAKSAEDEGAAVAVEEETAGGPRAKGTGEEEADNREQRRALAERATALMQAGRTNKAEGLCRELLGIDPDDTLACLYMAFIREEQEMVGGALIYYARALKSNPNLAVAANNMAWILATHEDERVRHGESAVRLARRACLLTHHLHPDMMMTLAAAYAEVGRFEEAVRTALKALTLLPSGASDERGRIESQLGLYRSGRALRDVKGGEGETIAGDRIREADEAFASAGLEAVLSSWPEEAGKWPLAIEAARILATHEDRRVRAGNKAVRLAKEVCKATSFRNAAALDALAAAYAEAGHFEEAARASQRALEHVCGQGAQAIRQRLRSYEAGLPVREAYAPRFEAGEMAGEALAIRRTAYVLYLAGQGLRRGAEVEAAERVFRFAASLDPGLDMSEAGWEVRHLRAGNDRPAERYLLTRLRSDPDDAEASCLLGMIHDERGQRHEAAHYYQMALAADPGFAPAANNLAWLRATSPEGTLRDGEEALRLARRACRAGGGADARMLVTLSGALAENGEFGEALEAIDRAIAMESSDEDEQRVEELRQIRAFYALGRAYRNDGRAFAELGAELLRRGELGEAERQMRAALRRRPQDPEALLLMGLIREAQGFVGGAVIYYTSAVRRDRNVPVAYNNMAWILATHPDARLRDAGTAIRAARRACELTEERHPKMLGTLAAAYAEAGRFDDARETVVRAIAAAERGGDEGAVQVLERHRRFYRLGVPYRRNAETHLRVARKLMESGQMAPAADVLDAALELEPEHPEVCLYLGMIREQEKGEAGKAAELYARALSRRPSLSVAANNLAMILAVDVGLHDPPRAVELAEGACARTGYGRPEFVYTLAIAYDAAGRTDDALPAAREAARLAYAAREDELRETIEEWIEERYQGAGAR